MRERDKLTAPFAKRDKLMQKAKLDRRCHPSGKSERWSEHRGATRPQKKSDSSKQYISPVSMEGNSRTCPAGRRARAWAWDSGQKETAAEQTRRILNAGGYDAVPFSCHLPHPARFQHLTVHYVSHLTSSPQ
jgi:hypothetical protein